MNTLVCMVEDQVLRLVGPPRKSAYSRMVPPGVPAVPNPVVSRKLEAHGAEAVSCITASSE